jgi:hypothetical protein
MKKLTIIAIAVALAAVFAVTASANEWNLYGSARMATFWTSEDFKDRGDDVFGRDSVDDLQWDFQGNSRIGATVKGDMISGRFEYGASGGNANIRRLYGVWNFMDGWGLKVGQDYTPITFFLSGQAFDTDNGLLFVGNAYGARKGQVAVEGMGFKFAAISPERTALQFDGAVGTTTTERRFPKIEASYEFKLSDAMSVHGFAGWQFYQQLWTAIDDATLAVLQREEDITSYMVGAGADLGFGPFFVKPQVSFYQNGAAAGWLNRNLGLNTALPLQVPIINATTNSVVDVDTLMAMLALGFKPTETLGLEFGVGYVDTMSDPSNGIEYENTYMEYYLQAVVTLAKGVFLVPEIGYRAYGDLEVTGEPDQDLGNLFYAGLKWQINF